MFKLADIFRAYGKTYLSKYSQSMLPSHKKAIYDISSCRTPVMGGQIYYCKDCDRYHYSYHSCGNRNCNTCQNDKAEQWLDKNYNLLLPVNYFMVTFTLPEDLRLPARENQKLFYRLLFNCSAESIGALSTNPKYIGGKTGYLGILHTWSRTLAFHPHIHYIITGGGLDVQNNKWIKANSKFLLPVKALSGIFKAKLRDELKKLRPEVYCQIPPDSWKKNWIVNSIPVGNGYHAMKYLAQYVFRVAISNSRIMTYDDRYVTFGYKDSKTKTRKTMKLDNEEFIRRFLQHVLPKGFVKVRYFGLFAAKNRKLLNKTKELLAPTDEKKDSLSNKIKCKPKIFYCTACGKEMKLVLTLPKIKYRNRPPPWDDVYLYRRRITTPVEIPVPFCVPLALDAK